MMPSLTTNTGLTGHDAGPSDQKNWNTQEIDETVLKCLASCK